METMNQRTAIATPAWPAASATSRALTLACATSATDARTADVRLVARALVVQGSSVSIPATKRDRATTGTPLMGHVGFAGYVPGSIAWSPPI